VCKASRRKLRRLNTCACTSTALRSKK
jgi:hypothetical protein